VTPIALIRKLVRPTAARSATVVSIRQHWGMLLPVVSGYERAAYRSWSQHGEDSMLVDLLRDELHRGFYVDVGANHPAVLSNTFRLYCLGMRGIIIEPNNVLCAFHARYRSRDKIVCAGIGDHDGLMEFHELNYHAFSTFSLEEAEGRVRAGSLIVRHSLKPVFRLDTVLRDVTVGGRDVFSLLSIDTEGFDEIVVRSNNWQLYRPRYVLVEYNTAEARERTSHLLTSLGYKLMRNFGCNGLYAET